MNVRRSLLLSFLEKYFTMGVNFVSVLVLARLLHPAEIGLFSVAAAMINIAQMLRDFGVASFLIQEKELTREQLATALGFALASGLVFAGVFAACAQPLAHWYHEPALRPVILTLSVNFVVVSLASLSTALLRRNMLFAGLARAGIAQAVVNVAVSVGSAYAGAGAMALAWGTTAGILANLVVAQLHLSGRMPLRPSFKEWRRLAAFGAFASGATLLVGIGQRLPDLVIGRVLGVAATGFFSRGNSFVTLFNHAVIQAIWPVSVATLAQLHRSGQDLKPPFLASLSHLTCVAWPMLAVLALLAHPLMLVAFGEQWLPAVAVSRMMCLATAIAVVTQLSFSLVNATGNVRLPMRVQAIVVPLQVPLLLATAPSGDLALIGLTTVAAELLQAILYGRASLRAIGANWAEAARACRISVAVTVVAVAPAAGVVALKGWACPLSWGGLAAVLAATAAAWLAAVVALGHPLRAELALMLRGWGLA